MTRRSKIIILTVLLIAALLLLAWLLWSLRSAVLGPAPVTPTGTGTLPTTIVPVAPPKPTIEETARIQTSSVQSVSKTFTERYGSFSSESNFANLTDLLPLMTADFAAETRTYIATTPAPTTFYGVTTHVVSVSVTSQDEAAGTAEVSIETQREEATGSIQNVTIKYQTLILRLEKVGEDWRVDSATWM